MIVSVNSSLSLKANQSSLVSVNNSLSLKQNITDIWRFVTVNVSASNALGYTVVNQLNATLDSASNYSVKCDLILYSNLTTNGVQFQIAVTGGIIKIMWIYTSPDERRAIESVVQTLPTSTLLDTGSPYATTYYTAEIYGYIETNLTSNNYVQWKIAPEVNGNYIEVGRGSRCVYTKQQPGDVL
jgi:hypothetical protein